MQNGLKFWTFLDIGLCINADWNIIKDLYLMKNQSIIEAWCDPSYIIIASNWTWVEFVVLVHTIWIFYHYSTHGSDHWKEVKWYLEKAMHQVSMWKLRPNNSIMRSNNLKNITQNCIFLVWTIQADGSNKSSTYLHESLDNRRALNTNQIWPFLIALGLLSLYSPSLRWGIRVRVRKPRLFSNWW